MAKPGGQTTFSGTDYQADITTLHLGRLIDPRLRGDDQMIVEVRPECDIEAEVDDILVRFKDGHTEWFQVKENIQKSGDAWRKMWRHFEEQLTLVRHPGDRIVLILGNPQTWSKNLRDVCDRARFAKGVGEWLKEGELNQEHLNILDGLKKELEE